MFLRNSPHIFLPKRISPLYFPNLFCFRFHGYVGGQVKTSPCFWHLVKLSMWAMFVSGVARDMFSRIPNPWFFSRKIISFTSYEQPIRISNFCNEFFLLTLLRPKYIKKCQYNSLHTKKNKNTLQHLKLGKFVKLVVWWAERDMVFFDIIVNFITQKLKSKHTSFWGNERRKTPNILHLRSGEINLQQNCVYWSKWSTCAMCGCAPQLTLWLWRSWAYPKKSKLLFIKIVKYQPHYTYS